ncbi:MAG: HD domain-containing protein, partial [Phycisphaerales bacterium]|nr:HD domain-containing protein [Phycisphaerales bacterium]
MQTDLSLISRALSDALDLVGVTETGHGKRVAVMAMRCGETYGIGGRRANDLLNAALLHDCGVSSTRVHTNLVENLHWSGSDYHCLRGAGLLDMFAPFEHLAPVLRHHHTLWRERSSQDVTDGDFELANCIFLADRVDALVGQMGGDVLVVRGAVRDAIVELRDEFFQPALVEAFLDASACEAFWLTLAPEYLHGELDRHRSLGGPVTLGMRELKQLARLFARIVDAKSRYTAEHSLGVARLAAFVARLYELPEPRCDLLEVAGLLHDVGK